MLGSLIGSLLDAVSDADVAGLSDRRHPAAPLESCPPKDFAVCFCPVPGGDSCQSAALPGLLQPIMLWKHLFRPRAPLSCHPADLFHLSEDPKQVSSKDTLQLLFTPAPPQQLLDEHWVRRHVLQPLREPVQRPTVRPWLQSSSSVCCPTSPRHI